MSLDAYSLCPGGTGKKIKFCCNDFLPELQKIDRMLEGEQYLACLQHVDQLMAKKPGRDRECLMAIRCELLHLTDQHEAAKEAAAAFVAKRPDNVMALAESAIAAAPTDARAAFDWQQRMMRAANGNIQARPYLAIGATAMAMLREARPVSARALLQLQAGMANEDDRPRVLLTRLCQAADIPLLLREDAPFLPAPNDAPWQERFQEAMGSAAIGDWLRAVEGLSALAADVPGGVPVWRNLATLRGWLGDNAGCVDALRHYARLRAEESDGLEDAVEAEATALFLADDPLGDRIEMFKLTWTVKDADRLFEALSSSSRWRPVPFDPVEFSDGENPPPKGAYTLLDRDMPDSAEGLTLDTIPRMFGQALLFGRQTDREARLEVVNVAADELDAVARMVLDLAGDAVEPEPTREVLGHWSASQKLLRASWQPPRGTSPAQIRDMISRYVKDAILDRWPDLKLGVLDGRSPREAARDEALRLRTLAAIMVLEHWTDRLCDTIDFNDLRAKLGLPTLDPIDPNQQAAELLPAVRLDRLKLEGLSDDDLMAAYYRASGYAIRKAMRKFALAILDRPRFVGKNESLGAYATLARTEDDLSKAIEWVDRGRQAAEKAKQSTATWDLMELSFRFAQRNGEEVIRLVRHIEKHHLNEPGVGETLTQMLIDIGLLRPDGTPAMPPEAAAQGEAPAEAVATEEPAGLWTPDSAQPGAGGGKLWTPD